MTRLLVISIGSGDPEHVTMEAVAALNRVDVIFLFDKRDETQDLVGLRVDICARYLEPDRKLRFVAIDDPERRLPPASDPGYGAAVAAWHDQRLTLLDDAFRRELEPGQTGGLLVWGDPAIYDSTLRLLDQLTTRRQAMADDSTPEAAPISYTVIPGISAVQVLAARHRVALHRVGGSIHITTGRRLAAGLPDGVDDVVVMLDGDTAFRGLEASEWDIYWGAYLGTPDEILVAGPLGEVADEIVRVRAEARARKGWMFDTYLLRRNERSERTERSERPKRSDQADGQAASPKRAAS